MARLKQLTKKAVLWSIYKYQEKWNQGDREGVRERYTKKVTILDSNERVDGIADFMKCLRRDFPNAKAMGHLDMRMTKCLLAPGRHPTMATSISVRHLALKNGKHWFGNCHETYVLDEEGKVRVAEVAMVTTWPKPKQKRKRKRVRKGGTHATANDR